MAITTPIAGHYNGTYNAQVLGYTENGYELQLEAAGELLNSTDAYGDSIIDIVYRGGNCYIRAESKVSNAAGVAAAFWPWGATGVAFTAAAPIGRLASAVAAALVLTATAGTPAAASPASLTGSKAILPPGSNLAYIFNSKVRNVPLRWLLLLTETAGVGSFYSET